MGNRATPDRRPPEKADSLWCQSQNGKDFFGRSRRTTSALCQRVDDVMGRAERPGPDRTRLEG